MPPGPLLRSPLRELPQVHQIVLPTPWSVGPIQVYLIESQPLTLLDTGVRSPESRAGLASALEELGYGFEDLERVVLTHWHGDHLGQAQVLREAARGGLEVVVHELEAVWCEEFSPERDLNIEDTLALFAEYGVPESIRSRQRERWSEWLGEDPLCGPSPVDRVVRDGERLAFKDFSVEVLHAPGHTEGHLLLHEPRSGTLFTGDHIMGNAVPFTDTHYLEGAPSPEDPLTRRPRFRGLPAYRESLHALRGRSFRNLLPAHGGVLDHPARSIEDAWLFYEVRVQRIERSLGKLTDTGGRVTAWDLWRHVFPKADPVSEMRNRMYMVIGALDLFEERGSVSVMRGDDGVLRYGSCEDASKRESR